MIDLAEIRNELMQKGFAARTGRPEDVRIATYTTNRGVSWKARESGLTEILKPMTPDEAPSRSLSATYGLGPQPLHTDGAHLATPPDIVVLYSAKPTNTSTLVWKLPIRTPSFLRSGVFTVNKLDGSFLTHAYENSRLRYDPGCMTPSDHLAKKVVSYFDAARSDAHIHQWSEDDTLLFIENNRALHARDALRTPEEQNTRHIQRMTFSLERNE